MTPTTNSEALAAYKPSDEERMWGLLAHLSAMVFLFMGPLAVLLIKGGESKYVRAHAIESLNFSITLTIGYAIGGALFIVFIGLCVLVAVGACAVIFHIVAAVRAWQGGAYRYPFALRLIPE